MGAPALQDGPRHVVLGCYSNFSFLRGAAHPHEMVEAAAALGWDAIGIADVNSLAGIVRAHVAARDHGIRLVVGARLAPVDGPQVIVHPTDRAGYESLSVLLSEANLRGSKAAPVLHLADFSRLAKSAALLVMPPRHPDSSHATQLGRIRDIAAGRVFAGAALYRDGGDEARLALLSEMAAAQGLPLTAVSDALYHHASRRPLADVLTCIREKQRLDTAGALLSRNAERQILDPAEMARRWRHAPQALANAAELAGLCDFAMDDLSYEYPDEVSPGGRDAMGEAVGDQGLPIDLSLDPVIPEVGHLDQIHSPLERCEVLVLLECVQMQLIGAGEKQHIEMENRVRQRDRSLLAGGQEVLVALDRFLEQVVVLDDPAVGLHQVAERLVELKVAQVRRQGRQPLVRGQLTNARVDVHLGLDGHDAHAITP